MMNDLEIWLERLSSLYKSQMRHAASLEGLQVVHLEILRYFSIANHYSNTAQALSEYLGQTKGSISQSLKLLEKANYIERRPCQTDKRAIRIYLTETGEGALERMSEHLIPDLEEGQSDIETIKKLIQKWQTKNNNNGFGQCASCRYNNELGRGKFQCGLTGAPLTKKDTKQICREHEFPEFNNLLG